MYCLWKMYVNTFSLSIGDFLCIPPPNTGQLNPLFHTFVEFRLIVNRIVARQSTDWLAANAQFSPNGPSHGYRDVVMFHEKIHCFGGGKLKFWRR